MGVLRETGGIQIVEYSLFLFYDGTLPRKFPASCRNGFVPVLFSTWMAFRVIASPDSLSFSV